MKTSDDPFDPLFINIYNQNYNYLVNYLYLLVYDLGIAEDLAHDIFLRVYKSKNSEITGIKLRNYLKKSARNIAVDHLRRISRDEIKFQKIIPEIREFDEAFYFNLENCIIEGEVLSTVQDVLEEYSKKNRQIFISRIMDNKTRRQVSLEEDISPHSIKKIESEILYVLRKKLRHYLDK